MRYAVKEAREAVGISQEELAKKAGISRTTLWRMEQSDADRFGVKSKSLAAVARALNKQVSDIFLI